MKKFLIILFTALMFLSTFVHSFAFEVDWEEDFVAEIGNISLPEATPSIDGQITEGEGWSEAKYFDKTNTEGAWGGQVVDVYGNLYRAFDSENLYIAANINIPEYSLCEGEDWIEGTDTGDLPGWDGDVFILSLDPMQALLNQGFGTDPAAWYCIGLFDGGEVRTYRTHINDKEITDIVSAKGNVTENGWMFEAAIPWKTICDDIEELSFGYVEITPEDILKEGNIISASMIYYDRRYDPEADKRITHSRYVTVATVFPDGTLGVVGTPWTIQAHGIFLNVEPSKKEEQSNDAAVKEENTSSKETASPQTNNQKPTTQQQSSKKPTSSSASNTPSPQTFDTGIVTMLGILGVSAAGMVYFKKRKWF
ncbi:MAG: hypothetical protein IKU52_02445 [Clostridia bacterium]|nr:hypothetical protein [Clostridia bacterium]